jgi:hypothetical protein
LLRIEKLYIQSVSDTATDSTGQDDQVFFFGFEHLEENKGLKDNTLSTLPSRLSTLPVSLNTLKKTKDLSAK